MAAFVVLAGSAGLGAWVGLVALAVSAGLGVLAVLVVLAGSVGLGVLAVLVVLAGSVGLGVLAALVGEIVCPPCRLGAATSGNTIPSIAVGLHTKTGQLQIASAERRVAILSPIVRRAPGNKLEGKGETWPVPAEGLD